MAEWVSAAMEGLAGISDLSGQFRTVRLSPRWAAAAVGEVRATVRYGPSRAYLSYRMRTDVASRSIELACTGSGEKAEVRILLPEAWTPTAALDGAKPLALRVETAGESRYACLSTALAGVRTITIRCDAP